ncbi:MAG: maltose alpha-D-glucosyltransferase [Gemmatimonadota bacterium]
MSDPLWYKDAVVYQLRVRSFFDSDGDGIGDLRGLTSKLGYLQDLGVTALWLLPFYPSPLRDDGYDISDYTAVDPEVGTLQDAKAFLREAHRRGLRVITELVLNHTSDQHRWFQQARRATPGSRRRDFYVWSDTPDRYADARIIFKDFEASNWTWDSVAKAYFWHRFYSHQPDLNYESPDVRRAMLKALDFWLKLGVDGLRLDAVPYLVEREGTSCENLPETHAVLKDVRAHVEGRFEERMLLAEANQWPEDAVAYFGEGDECHMAFHFPIMPRLFMSLQMEDRFPIVDILAQTPPIPASCQWATFLRNHDELTLEMVTDEERDYMYRVYANDARARINLGIRRRLAPLLGNGRRRIELMNALLFSLPGTPVLYYGDEIGMGDNFYLGDRNGVRTPMQWSSDRNAGFSRANPQKLLLPVIIDPEYHYETVNVEAQQNNRHSLLWWTKRLIALRKRYRSFGRGSIELLHPRNRRVLAFLRRDAEETVLVVANLSRYVQYVELDLAAFRGQVPVEVFGRTPFPAVGELPYLLTLGPHAFYWFSLEIEAPASPPPGESVPAVRIAAELGSVPELTVRGGWETALEGEARATLEAALPRHLRGRRWFGGKARAIKTARLAATLPLAAAEPATVVAFVAVDYVEGETETYVLPLAFAEGTHAEDVRRWWPQAVVARLRCTGGEAAVVVEGVLYDALQEAGVWRALLQAVARRKQLRGDGEEVAALSTPAFRRLGGAAGDLPLRVGASEQSNSSAFFGERWVLKLLRRLPEGVSPDLEIGRFLTERTRFRHVPPMAGALEVRRGRAEPRTLAILHGYVPNEGDAWEYALDEVRRYLERALTRRGVEPDVEEAPLLELGGRAMPELALELMGPYLENARLLGRRTAELHLALASAPDDPAFAAEPFTPFYQRALYQSLRNLTSRVFGLVRERPAEVAAWTRADPQRLPALEGEILRAFEPVMRRKLGGMRIRCHGDYHLGQALFTGRDFWIVDFEGEPARSLSERRLKRSPLLDVAGMLRSFHYAAETGLATAASTGLVGAGDAAALEPWARFWRRWAGAAFLRAYLDGACESPILPRGREELELLLHALLLEKAVYELGYELNNRPAWAWLPLRGIEELLRESPGRLSAGDTSSGGRLRPR